MTLKKFIPRKAAMAEKITPFKKEFILGLICNANMIPTGAKEK